MHRYVAPSLGAYTILFTFITFIYLIVLSSHARQATHVQTGAMAAATMHTTTFALLLWSASLSLSSKMHELFAAYGIVIYLFGMASSIAAAGLSITTVVWLNVAEAENEVIYLERQKYVRGLAAFSSLAWVGQLAFLTLQYLANRAVQNGSSSLFNRKRAVWSPNHYIKSVPYSRTVPRKSESIEGSFCGSPTSPTGSTSGFISSKSKSFKSSVGQAFQPISNRVKELFTRSKESRPLSLYSHLYKNSMNTTLPVSQRTPVSAYTRRPARQFGHEAMMPKAKTFQTIYPSRPDAETPSPSAMSPSPTFPRRTKSFSPSPAPRRSFLGVPQVAGDVHIHPLFRMDSPSMAPIVNPVEGTLAGRSMANRRSLFAFHNRSGSVPASPVSRVEYDLVPAPLELPASPVARLTPLVTRLSVEVNIPPPIPERRQRLRQHQRRSSVPPPVPPKDY
ncbi:hypothetical protein VHEMI05193 [[Torrubiella] hemipterigena]|uniref:Uncharacterized protein n=1 Tax=[Torrubiella] hemipterigena TaxID=1531966 RepID=A0A0A1TG11_9HYPO|nr:hypothetical protein VHEMI05193 [[Torrubiella] hemipterigena]